MKDSISLASPSHTGMGCGVQTDSHRFQGLERHVDCDESLRNEGVHFPSRRATAYRERPELHANIMSVDSFAMTKSLKK